jgi:Zn-dependent membrane protease YugP
LNVLQGLLVTWWPVLALLHVPRLAQALAVVVATRTKSALDHRIPDELPMTAGDWLADRLDELRHPISAIVTDRQSDGYRPTERLIQLSEETHFKADPSYWATAAHELGHARIRAELPIIGHLRTLAAVLGAVLIAIGVGLAFGHVFYSPSGALPGASASAFRCLALAAALRVFVLVDEGVASVIAYRELRACDAIDFVHLRAIRRVLVTAFATYLVTYAAYAALLHYWPLVDALAGHAAAPARLTALGRVIAIVASLGCVGSILAGLVWMFAPKDLGTALEPRPALRLTLAFLRATSIIVLLWLAWDHRIDPIYAGCATLAFAASATTWLTLLHLPFAIPQVIATQWLSRFAGRGIDRTARYLRARERGSYDVRRGNRLLEYLAKRRAGEPIWWHRLTALSRLGYLPLLITFWFT